ncbi:MAG: RsmD family RNA methyltransferase [Myxococcales bacterium]
MKILKGRFKGVPLAVPQDGSVRPTVDHLKKHVFGNADTQPHAVVWDLFAGSGGVGLEFLSRGAREVVFVEQQKAAIACIQLNLAECRLKDPAAFAAQSARVVKAAVEPFLREPAAFGETAAPELVFLDPPYGQGLTAKTLAQLAACALVRPGTRVVVEHVVEDPLGDTTPFTVERHETWGPKQLARLVRR